ncbi:MAG: hypothetical protein ABW044_04240 [Cellvibrio sp.]
MGQPQKEADQKEMKSPHIKEREYYTLKTASSTNNLLIFNPPAST